MYAAFMTINVKPDDLKNFLEACVEEGKASVREEPNCYRFEILRDKRNPNRVCFMEIFRDEQALETHWETPHFNKMWETIEGMIEGDANPPVVWNEVDQIDMEFVYTSDDSLGS